VTPHDGASIGHRGRGHRYIEAGIRPGGHDPVSVELGTARFGIVEITPRHDVDALQSGLFRNLADGHSGKWLKSGLIEARRRPI
jgi:hypothetical protein